MSGKNIKEWRSEEIAKLFLLKSSNDLQIEEQPSSMRFFDFIVRLKNKPKVVFAVEVKSKHTSFKNIIDQSQTYIKYRDMGMIKMPVLLMRIDDEKEEGDVDFLVLPSKTGKLLVKKNYNFQKITPARLDSLIYKIENWNKNK